jgi:FkbM family methyltransferase
MFKDILHIGAHFGQERIEYENISTGRILWVEADPKIYKQLNEILQEIPMNLDRHHTLNAFVTGSTKRKVVLNEFSNLGASNSIYLPNKRFKKFWPSIDVVGTKELENLLTLSEIVAKFHIVGSNNLLVLDTQGHEYEILKNSNLVLRHFREITCELTKKRVYKGQPSYRKTVKAIVNAGFQLETEIKQNHFDGHFVRNESWL